jgi:hypothetical protein
VQSVRVITGTATGMRVVADAGATPVAPGAANVGVCTISADGKTLTFEAAVTRVRVIYTPRPATALSSKFTRA